MLAGWALVSVAGRWQVARLGQVLGGKEWEVANQSTEEMKESDKRHWASCDEQQYSCCTGVPSGSRKFEERFDLKGTERDSESLTYCHSMTYDIRKRESFPFLGSSRGASGS